MAFKDITPWKKPIRKVQWVFALIGAVLAPVPPLSLLLGFAPVVAIEILFFDNTPDEGKDY